LCTLLGGFTDGLLCRLLCRLPRLLRAALARALLRRPAAGLLRPTALDCIVRPLLDLLYALGDASRRVRLVCAAQAFAALRLRTRARRLELALVPLQLVLVQLAAANLVAVNVLRPILRHLSSSFSRTAPRLTSRAPPPYIRFRSSHLSSVGRATVS